MVMGGREGWGLVGDNKSRRCGDPTFALDRGGGGCEVSWGVRTECRDSEGVPWWVCFLSIWGREGEVLYSTLVSCRPFLFCGRYLGVWRECER